MRLRAFHSDKNCCHSIHCRSMSARTFQPAWPVINRATGGPRPSRIIRFSSAIVRPSAFAARLGGKYPQVLGSGVARGVGVQLVVRPVSRVAAVEIVAGIVREITLRIVVPGRRGARIAGNGAEVRPEV